jgi:hypothetical protein
MIRQPALEIMSYLKAANYSSPAIRYVLCILFTCIKIILSVLTNIVPYTVIVYLHSSIIKVLLIMITYLQAHKHLTIQPIN